MTTAKHDYRTMPPYIDAYRTNHYSFEKLELGEFKAVMLSESYSHDVEAIGEQLLRGMITGDEDDYIVQIGYWGDRSFVVRMNRDRDRRIVEEYIDPDMDVT